MSFRVIFFAIGGPIMGARPKPGQGSSKRRSGAGIRGSGRRRLAAAGNAPGPPQTEGRENLRRQDHEVPESRENGELRRRSAVSPDAPDERSEDEVPRGGDERELQARAARPADPGLLRNLVASPGEPGSQQEGEREKTRPDRDSDLRR